MQVMGIDINLVRGVLLVLLIIGFLAMWAWAWSRNRKTDFEQLSLLPLEEDNGLIPDGSTKNERSKE